MVRISDILKQNNQPPEPEKDKREESPPVKEGVSQNANGLKDKGTDGIQLAKAIGQQGPLGEKEMQVAKAMHQMHLDPEESLNIYNRAVEVNKDILRKLKIKDGPLPLDLSMAVSIVKEIVDRIVLGDKELIALTSADSSADYLHTHMVNACILAVDVGLGMGYNKSKLNELGVGAFLHDLGMLKAMDIASKPHKLNPDEYSQIKKHPIYNSDILGKIGDASAGVIAIFEQTHERVNGSGYPHGLKGAQIHEYAKIVSIVDVYEALTHHRAYHQALGLHEAVIELLNLHSTGLFETSILKLMINKIGLYPPGSWVELNSGEIAKVVAPNDDFPLRPQVNIIFSAKKEKVASIKSINLSLQTAVYITRSVNPQELNLKL